MGYMGLSHWVESDHAADFLYNLQEKIDTLFVEELENEANCYNTPGWLNALLILKSYPNLIHFVTDETVSKIRDGIKSDGEDGYLKNETDRRPLVRNFNKICKERDK
jgi:hypothetical protein